MMRQRISCWVRTKSRFNLQFTIAHEIGHVVLRHRNSIGYEPNDSTAYKQSRGEVHKQEQEADKFAERLLN